MVDFIFGVSHPQHWHSLNIQANPHHYSVLGKLGSKAVATMQEGFGAGVYFNPFVEVNGMVRRSLSVPLSFWLFIGSEPFINIPSSYAITDSQVWSRVHRYPV